MMSISHWGCLYIKSDLDRWTVRQLLAMARADQGWFPARLADFFL